MNKYTNTQFDIVIVGSGPAGLHAAYPLVEAGLQVAIIDGGLDSEKQDRELCEFPDANIIKSGHYYNFIKKSSYVFNKTYQLLKIKSNIEVIQSLAKGGLSEAWHGICDFYTKDELEAIGLPVNEINREYQEIARRINLTKQKNLDINSSLIIEASKNKKLSKSKVYQVPRVFPYRTRTFIDDLKRFKNFTYIQNQLVVEVHEKETHIEVQSFSVDKGKELTTKTNFLILAAGSINSTRILLRSLGLYNYKTTFLTKANYLMACLHPRTLFKKNELKKTNTGQVVIFSQKTNHEAGGIFTQIYKFNPLVLHKVLKYILLPKFMALPLLSMFAASLVIADVRFPAFESKKKFSMLKKGTDGEDVLEISFHESIDELKSYKKDCNKIAQELRFLGLFPLKTISAPITSHYAGGVPYGDKALKLSVNSQGKLHQARRIYVADSSTWRALPAKPLAFTIMANAARVGKNVLKDFNRFR